MKPPSETFGLPAIAGLFLVLSWLLAPAAMPQEKPDSISVPEAPVVASASDEPAESDEEALDDPGADPDAEKYRGLEEIMVTARGGTRNLQDIGSSVAAFDADYLQALGAQNIADISQFTPNLEIRSVFAASNPTLFIRGVGLRDFNANSASAVAVYNDDIYMASPAGQLGQLFDVQQVEVLRGPQGTLYGRNASAGAIRVISRKPTGETNGYSRLTYGKYNDVEAEGAMEVPISETVSVRISGRMKKRDGYTKNRCADPQYSVNDPRQPASSFQNLVWRHCFNPDTTRQDFYPESPVFDTSLTGPTRNEFTDTQNRPYYGVGFNTASARLIPWYRNQDLVNGQPIPGAIEKPTGYNDCIGGCSYADGSLVGAEPVKLAAPYYSQKWKKGAVPHDIDLWTNNVDNWAARGLLRWQPREGVDWVLNAHGGMNRGDSLQFQMVGAYQGFLDPGPDLNNYRDADQYFDPDLMRTDPWDGSYPYQRPEDGDPYAGDYNRVGTEMLNLYGASLTGEFHFDDDNALFRSITGFEGNERSVQVNMDANPYPVGFEPIYRNEAWQLSQEFKLNWSDENEWDVETGAMYLFEKLNARNDWPIDPLSAYNIQQYETNSHYASAYMWVDWHPSPLFSVTAGGRWNYEVKDMDLNTAQMRRTLFGTFRPPVDTASSQASISSNAPSGDISFNYTPTDDRLFFLKYARGFKGPHINGGVINADALNQDADDLTTPVEPEKVDALEFGIKTSWLDNQLTVNGSVFYYDYQDIQIFQLRNSANAAPVNQLVNADDADVYGAEIELRTQPLYGRVPQSIDSLEIFASFGWLNARYTDFVNRLTTFTDGGFEIFREEDNSGNRLINAPEFAFAGYVSWPIQTRFGLLSPRYDWSYKGQVFFSPTNNLPLSQDPLWLMNFRFAYTTPGRNIEIAGWVRNMTNEVYRVDVVDNARFRRSLLYAMGEPRTYGVTLSARF